MLGKKATKVFVVGDGMEKFFPAAKIMVTGNPVRRAIASSGILKSDAIKFFGLDENRKTILAVGGSLGARSINEALATHIEEFERNNLQLIWQTGKTTAAEYIARGKDKPNVWVSDFITDMEKAYAAADIVISRAGAMSVAELCVAKKPVVFVPFPHAAEDHQTVNAQHLVNKQAALMVKDSEAKDKLVATVMALAINEQLQTELKINISSLAITNADEVIAKEILRTIN